MASKNHVDSSVAERRLRPIYNWLDDGNNKKALQEAEKVLKKQPNFQCAKVLKGLALLRLGKENECIQLLEAVRKDVQCDDSTLQAMTICYREMNKPEVICDVYLAATKKDPHNEELLTHLFMAFVRICDYKKQQQTAMALYKLKFKNHYYFWAVMSIVMQAHEAGPDLAKTLQLPLAEKMVKKFVEENKIEAEQEVQLYLMILEMQNKLTDALAVVEGPLGEMLNSYILVSSTRVELLVKMGCWKRANLEIKNLLVNDLDNWSLYLNYFKTVFQIVDLKSNDDGMVESNMFDKTLNDSVTFIKDIKMKNQVGCHSLRGPYLAVLEFYVQLKDKGIDAKLYFGYFTDLLLEYFQNFGSKTCCLNDLRPYLDGLSKLQVTVFLDAIWKFIELEDGQLPISKQQMLRYISNLHITRYLGFHDKLNVKAKIQLAECLLKYYIHGAQFDDSNLLATDIRQNDPFVTLIVEIMNDIWMETEDATFLKNAIVILEYGLNKSPANHQFKLFLIKLYTILGISKAAHKIYDLLDVKHVQLDSMGYLLCWPLISTGQYFLASHLYEITLKFFISNYKDSADHLTFLYKFGSFLKINEFIEFRERLNNSLHYSTVKVEKMLLEIFHSSSHQSTLDLINRMAVDPEKEDIKFNNLEDHRDLDLCWTSGPHDRMMSHELVKISFEHNVEFLRIRSLVLRILIGAAQFAHSSDTIQNGRSECYYSRTGEKGQYKILESLSQQLSYFSHSLLDKNFTRLPKNVIHLPMDSRLFFMSELPYLDLLGTLNNSLLTILEGDLIKIKSICDEKKNPLVKLKEAISIFATECKSSDHSQLELRCRLLNLLTLLCEMLAIACLFCGAIFEIIKSNTNHQVKKGKKKKDSTMSDQTKKSFADKETALVNFAKDVLALTNSSEEDLEHCIMLLEDKWREEINSDNDISNFVEVLTLEDVNFSEQCKIHKTALDSYQSSLSEIHNVIRVKSKYLSELQL